MDKQKREAEKALAAVGGMVTAGYAGPVPEAQPAPRNAERQLAPASPARSTTRPAPAAASRRACSTRSTRPGWPASADYVTCWRTQSWGEHPKGRACDFAAEPNSFGGAATGADKTYGNRLAAWAKTNAEALGVLYVIWYQTDLDAWHRLAVVLRLRRPVQRAHQPRTHLDALVAPSSI